MGSLKKFFFTGLTILSSVIFQTVTPLRCISMTNQECKVRPQIVNVNSDEPVFYPFSIQTSKCSGSCNNINDPDATMCVPDVVKNLNVKVFNLMSRINETRHIECHETCICKCRLDASTCNNKQRWNDDKCRCECKKIIDKGVCYKGFIWNPSNCECECNKSCDIDEYLDYENCKCRKKLADKLIERSSAEECTKNIDDAKIADENECVCSYIICVVLAVIALAISIEIGAYYRIKILIFTILDISKLKKLVIVKIFTV